MEYVKKIKSRILELQYEIEKLENDISKYYDNLCENMSKDKLRPMKSEDVKVGQMFVGYGYEGWFIGRISEVDDIFLETFYADDGYDYYVEDCYILIKG